MSITRLFNRRTTERFSTPAMHTGVAVRPLASVVEEDVMLGHAYDISEGGIRIELDEPLATGQFVTIRIETPGRNGAVDATGRVVWQADVEDDPGPRRMALAFTGFASTKDRRRLIETLAAGGLRRAA